MATKNRNTNGNMADDKAAKKQAELKAKEAADFKSAASEVLAEKINLINSLADNAAESQIRAGEEFASVKNDKEAVKAVYGSFRKFCEQTKFDHSTIYLLVQIVEAPKLKAKYAELGQLKCKVLLANKLESDVSAIEFAESHTTAELKERISDNKESAAVTAVAEETDMAKLLADKSKIKEQILQLKNRIALLEDDMSIIDQRINELTKN